MKKKIKLVKEYDALWRTEYVKGSIGNYIISTKLHKIRHKNDTQNSMVTED